MELGVPILYRNAETKLQDRTHSCCLPDQSWHPSNTSSCWSRGLGTPVCSLSQHLLSPNPVLSPTAGGKHHCPSYPDQDQGMEGVLGEPHLPGTAPHARQEQLLELQPWHFCQGLGIRHKC